MTTRPSDVTTVDPATAIQHAQAQAAHAAQVRAAEEQRQRETTERANAEVDSWPPPMSYARPAAPPPPEREPVSYTPQNASEMYRYARMLGRCKLLPKGFYDKGDYDKLRPRIDDVHFVLLKGQALDLHPMTSIGNINIIDGKAEVGALLMLAQVRKSGLLAGWRLVHSDAQRAVFTTQRIGDDRWTEFEYTIEEAAQMGLLDKGRDEAARAKNQWRLQPRTMLRRRCQAMLLREVYTDVVLGLYDHGELEEMRERERALGVDPDRVIPMNGLPGAAAPQLVEPAGAGPIAAVTDPLKARLTARRAVAGETWTQHAAEGAARWGKTAATETETEPEPAARVCSSCQTPLDERDTDPCIGCR